jgi:hypothetical protein
MRRSEENHLARRERGVESEMFCKMKKIISVGEESYLKIRKKGSSPLIFASQASFPVPTSTARGSKER